MRTLTTITVLAVLTLFAACGSGDDSPSGDGDPTDPGTSALDETSDCDDWAGETMPETWYGCTLDGELQANLVYDDCEDGRVLHIAGTAYGFVGEPIAVSDGEGGLEDPEVRAAHQDCYPI